MPVGFRSLRDTGITWLALAGVPLQHMQRRAGHDGMDTTMGYVKEAEDLSGGAIGTPFAPLPAELAPENRTTNWPTKKESPASAGPYQYRERVSNAVGTDLSPGEMPVSAAESVAQPREYPADAAAREPVSAASERPPEALRTSLAGALKLAADAGKWDVVTQLAAELEAHRQGQGNL